MKPEEKILTYEQAKELKFFCRNVAGTRHEFYELYDAVLAYKAKIDRLDKTVKIIEEYFGEQFDKVESAFGNRPKVDL